MIPIQEYISNIKKVLGLNARNIEYISRHNLRKYYPLVDDKLICKEKLAQHNIPHVSLYFSASDFFSLKKFDAAIDPLNEFVIKPARGYGGKGILVLSKEGAEYVSPSGKRYSREDLNRHAREILFGVYSMDSKPDSVMVEERIKTPDFLMALTPGGLPDFRVITFKGNIMQAMLRLPTIESDGKANLHTGGVGAGIDIASGKITHAIHKGQAITHHPDTQSPLVGTELINWKQLCEDAKNVAQIFPLGYMGQDWIVGEDHKARVLELNARPGIEIQNANQKGLRQQLEEVIYV